MITKFKSAADFRKSLEMRLKGLSIKMDYDLQRLRREIAFDRLLARLLDHPAFVLKGGYAMELRFANARATKDIDLTCLKRLTDDQFSISDMVLDDLRKFAFKDLGDFFTYQIGDAQIDLDNAPYGGARFPVSSFIDGRLFVRFQLDLGCDAVVAGVEVHQGKDWLGFCGIPAPTFKMISIEQQFAEKLHAYSLPRENRMNTRVKDLVDMILIVKMRLLDLVSLRKTLDTVFNVRKTHPLPLQLDAPPSDWERPYLELAKECGLSASINEGFEGIATIYEKMITSDVQSKM
jgi:hypothetical protein